jgi:hypothetical protein
MAGANRTVCGTKSGFDSGEQNFSCPAIKILFRWNKKRRNFTLPNNPEGI